MEEIDGQGQKPIRTQSTVHCKKEQAYKITKSATLRKVNRNKPREHCTTKNVNEAISIYTSKSILHFCFIKVSTLWKCTVSTFSATET